MYTINRQIEANGKPIKIIPLGDLHIGSAKCDIEAIKAQVEVIRKEPNTYCVLLGDLINNSTKTSVGDVYSEPMSPMRQMQVCVDLFTPIKDKILAITSGNHERRTYKNDGVDLMAFFAQCLGLEKYYNYTSTLIFLKTGHSNVNGNPLVYTIYVTHGDGQGGKTTGGKANGLSRRGQVVDADIIITGHTHQPITFREAIYAVDKSHRKVIKREQVFVNVASPIDYEAYAEMVGMRPSASANPNVILSTNSHNIQVVM